MVGGAGVSGVCAWLADARGAVMATSGVDPGAYDPVIAASADDIRSVVRVDIAA